MTSVASRWPESIARWIEVPEDPERPPRVAPPTTDAVAQVLSACSDEGRRVRISGAGGWTGLGGAADLVLSTHRLVANESVSAADLVATVAAGTSLDAFRQRLADHQTWFPVDPPGAHRSMGSVLATATTGALAAGFGAVREQLLGLTIVTGEGRIVRPGGRVVKNVAGFDLTRVVTGTFGAYGVITQAHVRLRAKPEADLTVLIGGDRSHLFEIQDRARDAAVPVDALALSGRDARWILAARITGSQSRVTTAVEALNHLDPALRPLHGGQAADWWREHAEVATDQPVTVRLGALHTQLPAAVDLLSFLEPAHVSVHFGANLVRATADATADRLLDFRVRAVELGLSCTIERAPADVIARVGHYGPPPPPQVSIVGSIRALMDPRNILTTPLFPA